LSALFISSQQIKINTFIHKVKTIASTKEAQAVGQKVALRFSSVLPSCVSRSLALSFSLSLSSVSFDLLGLLVQRTGGEVINPQAAVFPAGDLQEDAVSADDRVKNRVP
jgi:hypothetical protein